MAQTVDPPAPTDSGPYPPIGGAVGRIASSAIRDLLALTERPDVISLAGGKPTPDAFPVEEVRAATDAVLARDGAAALQYSATEGDGPLREWLAARHSATAAARSGPTTAMTSTTAGGATPPARITVSSMPAAATPTVSATAPGMTTDGANSADAAGTAMPTGTPATDTPTVGPTATATTAGGANSAEAAGTAMATGTTAIGSPVSGAGAAGGGGSVVRAEWVTVTSGAQQGLDLVARALVGPGDVVVTADPGYVGAIQAFGLAGAEVVGVPDDRDGMRVDVLADRLAAGLRPRAAYLIPDLSNPTGATLSDERRAALVALADRYGFWLVEDDPYGALRWSGRAPAPLAARSDRVVTIGTVSKVLCPGLRVGYVVAPPPVTQAVVLVKQAADLHTSTLAQRIVHELVTRPGFLDRHLARLPDHYRERAAALTGALRRHAGDALDFAEPEGGMFVWARVTAGADTSQLLGAALDAGVAYVPGSAFAVSQPHDDRLRLSFATPTPVQIEEGVHRLATVLPRPG